MRFDWRRFLEQKKIRYVTRGPNVARGHINIKCPYCGNADPSEHMGLSTDVRDPKWGCFRNAQHRGRNPRRLVQALLGCTFEQSLSLVEMQNARVDEFEEVYDKLHAVITQSIIQDYKPDLVTLPREFRPIWRHGALNGPYADRFYLYIAERGFGQDTPQVCLDYDLHYALTGDQKERVIFPIAVQGQLRSWSGRAIHPNAVLRYKTRAETDKTLLYNYDVAVAKMPDCPTLSIVEGPFDTVKFDFYATAHGSTAVGILGTAVPPEQLAALATLLKGFESGLVIMDSDATVLNMQFCDTLRELSQIPVRACFLTEQLKDPGKMTPIQIEQVCAQHHAKILAAV